jgi:hypothetical protein
MNITGILGKALINAFYLVVGILGLIFYALIAIGLVLLATVLILIGYKRKDTENEFSRSS